MLAQAMNAQTIAEAEAGFVSNDPIWQEYNKQMGIMSHVYRLAASGMSREDVTDIINYDLENISDEAKQLGITEDMDSLRSDMLAYLDIIYQQKTEALKGIDASQSGDVSFANYLHRNLYYLSAKEHALSKFSDVKDQAGLQALKEDNAEMRNWLTNSRSKVKEQYLKEVAAAQSLEKETKRLREESQKEGVSEEAKQKLGEDYMKQKYMLEELMDIFGTTPLEYGEEAKDLHSPAIVSSASFRTQEASQLLKSNSRVQRKATALGTNRALSEELSEAAEDFSNSGDLGDVDRMIDSMSRLSPVTDVHTKSVNKALAKLQDVRKQTGDSAQALLDLTSPFDIEDKINEQTFTEEERAFLEESQVDPTDSNAIADAANAKIAELETLMEQIDIRSNTLSSIPIKPETAVSKFSWDAMVEEYVGDKFTAAESLLESFDEAPTEFLRGAEVNEMIQQLLLVSMVFKERKDVKKKLAERTVKKAEELLDRLKEVRRAVAMNNARRSALQAAAEIHYTNNSLSALGFSQGEFDRNGGFYRLLLTTFDNNDDKVKEIEEVLATASSGSLQALLLYVATSAPKDALNTFLAQNNAAYKNLAQQVDPNGATKILRDVFNNPLKYGPIILQSVLGGKVGFNDYNSPFFAYSKDKDIVKLRYALEEKSQGKPLPGMTAEETDFIFRKIDLMMDLITRRDIHFSLNSTLDAKKAYEAELSLEEEFENVESGGIPPSIQQSIAFREVLRNLFLPASGQKGNEITVLKGVLGSGKSLVGAKAAVSMWRHLTGATDDQIFAFGHSETSSEIIAKAIYGESSTVHSAEEFLTADLTKVKLVVIDEAMAIDRET